MIEIPSPAFFFFSSFPNCDTISFRLYRRFLTSGMVAAAMGKMRTNAFYSYNCDRENSHGGKLQAMGVHGQSCNTQLPVAMTLNG